MEEKTKKASANKTTKPVKNAKTSATKKSTEKKVITKKAEPKKLVNSKKSKNSSQTADKKIVTKKTPAKKVNAEKKRVKKEPSDAINVEIWGYNELVLSTNLYEDVENPKAVVLVAHGMMEHSGRYDAFAKFLNKNGYIVVTSDLRGHGKTALNKESFGLGDKDIFTETLYDLQGLIYFATERYKLPIYLFGHSYGSLLSQRLIQISPEIKKCVLCGTTNGSANIMKLGGFVCSLLAPFKKHTSKGGMIESMCIKAYGKKFSRGNWLTRDEKIFDKYIADPYCGGSFPFSFYKSMIKNCNKNNDEINKIGKKKLFLIVGSADPLSSGGKQVEKLHKLYLKHNIDSKLKIYKDARHELLNEINKVEVWQDILKFFNS